MEIEVGEYVRTKNGVIDKVYDKVKAANNPVEVLDYLKGK